jgi:signal transduction histidine kinase/CheY-like chemotaxis protein
VRRAEEALLIRVLVLAPVGRDADLAVALLSREGHVAEACADVSTLLQEIGRGAGMALVTEEALTQRTMPTLAAFVASQPKWSDFPFLVFTESEGATATVLSLLRPLGNLSVLERPVRMPTLLTAVDAALRARRRQYEVRRLLEEMQEGVRQRDEFLAMLGHELRNPLGAAMTALNVLDFADRKGAPLTADVVERQYAIVRRQTQVLSRLVDDLLEVSRITLGKVLLQKSMVDMAAVARCAVDAVRAMAVRQNLELSLHASRSVWINGDATRLEQVLSNLLTNAIKYTPAGGRVTVNLAAEGEEAVVRVCDSGVGIDAATLPCVFDMFRQAQRTLDRSLGGLGLGLTLVRSVVEMHGGRVEAASGGLGCGSEFIVRLPLAIAPVLTAPVGTVSPGPPSLLPTAGVPTRKRIVVVEDHEDNREALILLLEQFGHDVHAAVDGPGGVQVILESRPDIALVDVGLPGLDGYGVARIVRRALGSAILLVAITGYGRSEDQKRALEAGFDRHLSKPVDFDRLRQLLVEPRAAATAGGGRFSG